MTFNEWSYGKTVKIPVRDFFLNMRKIAVHDKIFEVEYDLLLGMLKQMKTEGMTRQEALDLIKEMLES